MKTAIVTIDSTQTKNKNFNRFCEILHLFQTKGFFSDTTIASSIHAALYPVPFKWYREMEARFSKEASTKIASLCTGKFDFNSVKILCSDSSHNEDLISQMSHYGKKTKSDLLILSSSDRTGIPYWFLGSFSETASLTATLPVLIIKPHVKLTDFSKEIKFLISVDASTSIPPKQIRWIIKKAQESKAQVQLIHVNPKPKLLIGKIQKNKSKEEAKQTLKEIQDRFKSAGVKVSSEVLEQAESVAQTIVDYAEKNKSWITITLGVKRSKTRKILLGSTARKVLSLTILFEINELLFSRLSFK
jgi:nucleotide-binding universal stress UspA family protein